MYAESLTVKVGCIAEDQAVRQQEAEQTTQVAAGNESTYTRIRACVSIESALFSTTRIFSS